MSIQFLHISDIHLDSPFHHIRNIFPELMIKCQEASKISFQYLVTYAIEQQVDIVVIAGDSFNSVYPSVSAQLFFKEQLQRLVDHHIQIVLCHGNHDYVRLPKIVALPEKVYVFDEHVETFVLTTKSQEKVAFSGFSYHHVHVQDRKVTHYPVRFSNVDYHVGVLHGALESIATEKGLYAPFSLSELNSKHYDYWALGHIHKRSILQEKPPIVYAGNIQGLNCKETGKKGAYLVTLDKGKEAVLEFIPAETILWEHVTLSLSECSTVEDVQSLLKKEEITSSQQTKIISIDFIEHAHIPEELRQFLQTDEALQVLSQNAMYIYRLTFLSSHTHTLNLNVSMEKKWGNIQQYGVENKEYQTALQSLFKNTTIRTLFPDLLHDDVFKEEVFSKAINTVEQQINH
ncbi:DNA repair exonuclease [Carnobacteriaceae bacterium zg-84]|uniref:metallophosphoesterase family protein n=1 Tax=Granulicatella sp. zg-84 TaxID=2678503 RepID=UPI0013C0DE67|nr:DNA repair exonuclease [Granulicatella sp. zg-84]NEW65844.1 hypothetical protein [Granulicatella sp. zg-84]QMI86381.1 DNA repair exonuclease [Carnobacteriaceae bacterium zg-84]